METDLEMEIILAEYFVKHLDENYLNTLTNMQIRNRKS